MLRSRAWLLAVCLISALISGACLDDDAGGGGGGGGGTPTPTPNPPGGSGTVVVGDTGFCQVGDAARMIPDNAGNLRFALPPEDFQSASDCTNGDDRDSKDDEYTFVFFNGTSGSYSFQIDQPDNTQPPTKIGGDGGPQVNFKEAFQQVLNQNGINQNTQSAKALVDYYKRQYHQSSPNPGVWPYSFNGPGGELFTNGNAVGDQVELRFPSDVDTENVCSNFSAVVRKIGSNAKFLVDVTVPFDNSDTSDDCSGSALGTRLCIGALDRMSDVFDNNFVPLVAKLTGGGPSDINGDGLVSIVITARLNNITLTDGDPFDLPAGVPNHGFAMQTDLLPFHGTNNPCSNEQEAIFVHAPDPFGFFNSYEDVPLNRYLSVDALGAIMFQYEKVVSFNEHVFVNDGDPEDDWLSNSLGMVLTDLAGFFSYSSSFMYDVFIWLDAPSYFSLTGTNRWYNAANQGFQYLFGKFLLDSQINNSLSEDSDNFDTDMAFFPRLYSTETGITNLEDNLDFTVDANADSEFSTMFQYFAIAVVAEGTTMELSGESFPYLKGQNTPLYGSAIADAGGSTRDGAAGDSLDDDAAQNPVGILLNGDNTVLANGLPVAFYNFENPDHFTYVPGKDFLGFTAPLALNFVRAGGLFEKVSNFAMAVSNGNGEGFVIRRPDIDTADPVTAREKVFPATNPTRELIDGSATQLVDYADTVAGVGTGRSPKLTIVGTIEPDSFVTVFDFVNGVVVTQNVPDIDFYNITIPNVLGNPDEADQLAVWVESQVSSVDGTTILQPALAVVSADDVPDLAALSQYGAVGSNVPQFRYVVAGTDDTGTAQTFEDLDDEVTNDCAAQDDQSPAAFPSFYDFTWTAFDATVNTMGLHFFNLFVLKNDPTDPPYDPFTDPPTFYEPRMLLTADLQCDATGGTDVGDASDILGADEAKLPSNFQEQILTYMAREKTNAGGTGFVSVHINNNDGPEDLLAKDVDSDDISPTGEESLQVDFGDHTGGYSVKIMENALLQTDHDLINPLIRDEIPVAATSNNGPMGFQPPGAADGLMHLTPGETYTIVIFNANSTGSTALPYELHLRKFDETKVDRGVTYVGFSE